MADHDSKMSCGRRFPSAPRGDAGVAAVEFALILPLLLLLIFGLIDLGRMFNAQITLTQAAREGVRLRAFGSPIITHDDVTQRVCDAATPMPCGSLSVGPAGPYPCDAGSSIQVLVTTEFTFATPVGAIAAIFSGDGSGLSGTKTLTGRGDMRCGG